MTKDHEWHDVGPAGDASEGHLRRVEAGGRAVCVGRLGDVWIAFDDTCTHEECPLSDGRLTADEVECPCHGSIFDLRSGEARTGPALESVRTHRVRVEDGRVQVLIAR